MSTLEDDAGVRLRQSFSQQPLIEILSFHPTSGKAYQYDLIRFIHRRDGVETRERNHVDVVFIAGTMLFLVELKGTSAESLADVEKLRGIRDSYTLGELLLNIERRMSRSVPQLAHIDRLVLGIGIVKHNGAIPQEFVVFETSDTGLVVHCQALLVPDLKPYFGDAIRAF